MINTILTNRYTARWPLRHAALTY